MFNLYRCVDLDENLNVDDDEMKYFHMYERNRVMTDKVVELMRSSPETKLFVAFGAAHFRGNGSVVEMLREKGFRVERVHAFEKL